MKDKLKELHNQHRDPTMDESKEFLKNLHTDIMKISKSLKQWMQDNKIGPADDLKNTIK